MRWLRRIIARTIRAGRSRGIPIAVALALGTGLLTLLTMGVLLGTGYEIARRNTTELVNDKAGLILRTLAERLDGHLRPVQQQLSYLAETLADARPSPSENPRLAPLLQGSLAATSQVSVIALVGPDLHVYRAFRNRPDRDLLISDWSDDERFRNMVRQAESEPGLFWGGFFVAETVGRPYLNLGLPVRRAEKFEGLLLASVSIAELSAFLSELGDTYLENAFILSDRIRVLAHPALRDGFKGVTDAEPLPSIQAVPDPVLHALSSSVPFTLDERRDPNLDLRIASVAGERYLFVLRDIDGESRRNWTLGTYLKLSALAPQLSRLNWLLQIGVGLLILAVIVSIYLGRRLSRPITGLAAAAARVRELDLDDVPRLRGGMFRELRDAAESFNSMLETLRLFDNYVPRQLVLRMMREGQRHPLPSEERDVTVMFTDLAGFTTLAEQMPATEVAALLNEHFRSVDQCVQATEGVLDKYMGDAVMAFWGAPDSLPDHAARACAAAVAIAGAIQRDNSRRGLEGLPPVRLRIGIHTGRVVVGNIGSPGRLNFTVIGDTVNVAQRLQDLASELATEENAAFILASEATVRGAGSDLPVTDLGKRSLRGRQDLIHIFEIESLIVGQDASDLAAP